MLAWYRVVYVSIYYWAARSMGLSSERFCHAAIGRLMDGDRGHWFSLVHPCVWLGADHTFTPITHTHTHWEFRRKLLLLLPSFWALQVLRRKCAAARPPGPAQMMSRLFLPPTYRTPPLSLSFLPRCVIHIQVHSAGVHASPTDTYIYIHRSLYI